MAKPKTKLGRKLASLRERAKASGMKLKSEAEIISDEPKNLKIEHLADCPSGFAREAYLLLYNILNGNFIPSGDLGPGISWQKLIKSKGRIFAELTTDDGSRMKIKISYETGEIVALDAVVVSNYSATGSYAYSYVRGGKIHFIGVSEDYRNRCKQWAKTWGVGVSFGGGTRKSPNGGRDDYR